MSEKKHLKKVVRQILHCFLTDKYLILKTGKGQRNRYNKLNLIGHTIAMASRLNLSYLEFDLFASNL